MIEGQLCELKRRCLLQHQLIPRKLTGCLLCLFAQERHPDNFFNTGHLRDDVANLVLYVDFAAGIVVTVTGKKHARLDLPKTVECTRRAEVGRAG